MITLILWHEINWSNRIFWLSFIDHKTINISSLMNFFPFKNCIYMMNIDISSNFSKWYTRIARIRKFHILYIYLVLMTMIVRYTGIFSSYSLHINVYRYWFLSTKIELKVGSYGWFMIKLYLYHAFIQIHKLYN